MLDADRYFVLEEFHNAQHANQAVDAVRRAGNRALLAEGHDSLAAKDRLAPLATAPSPDTARALGGARTNAAAHGDRAHRYRHHHAAAIG